MIFLYGRDLLHVALFSLKVEKMRHKIQLQIRFSKEKPFGDRH
jgi:hypothetical protein